jgi:hypothetical protein
LGKYLGNDERKLTNRGVYDSTNLALFSYVANNPMRMVDPDGNAKLSFADNTSPQERSMVVANLKAVENRINAQATGAPQERLSKSFEKWDVRFEGGGSSSSGTIAGSTKGREGRSTIYSGDQDTLAHEFYHTTPDNINTSSGARGLLGDAANDPGEHGEFGAANFASDILAGKDINKYSTGASVKPLPVEQPRRGFGQMLYESFKGDWENIKSLLGSGEHE